MVKESQVCNNQFAIPSIISFPLKVNDEVVLNPINYDEAVFEMSSGTDNLSLGFEDKFEHHLEIPQFTLES